jgi:DNA-binding transcriptional regulator LsrR (DeoR family)
MSNQDHKTLDGFPNESVAEITDVSRTKIERMLLQKYGKSLVEFRVYRRHKFPYLLAAKLKDGTYKTLALQ